MTSGGSSTRIRRLLRAWGAGAGAWILAASARMTRVSLIHNEHETEAINSNKAVIYAFWHGRMWLLAGRLRDRGAGVLVSLSEDGEVIAQTLSRLGLHPVRGSSSRRGREGLQELEELLRDGRSVAITPDGPRGPRHQARMGAVALASRTGKPVVPLSAAARSCWTFDSWDSFQVPRPGTRGVIVFGEPLYVPASDDLEPWRSRLERALIDVEAEADRELAP